MATNRFRPDRGLATRMVITAFLIGGLYAVLIVVLLQYLALSAVLVIAAVLLFSQYWFSDRIALYAMHGRVVTPQQAPQLHAIIDRLCALADMPKPQVAIADVDMPNAFATGRSPKRAVVCATTGILKRLDAEELEGVLAHELSHVAHRDVAVMTVASFLGVVAGFITRIGLYSEMFGGFGGGSGGRRGGGNNQNAAAAIMLMVLAAMVIYAISFLLTRALSRYRELSADRSGAMLTGRPSALASALTKVTGEIGRIPTRDLRHAEAFNAFFFAPAVAGGFSISSLFSTHPRLDVRLRALAKLSQQLGQAA
ncbi:MAG: zinc metalloprotease HtpX [Mycobacteriales bacterium]